MTKDKKENIDFKALYGKAATISVSELIKKEKIDLDKGLSSKEVENRISEYGYNEKKKKKEKKWYHYFLRSLFSAISEFAEPT